MANMFDHMPFEYERVMAEFKVLMRTKKELRLRQKLCIYKYLCNYEYIFFPFSFFLSFF
jgi:hypothetical protein